MTVLVWRRGDGRIALDWTVVGGPFVVLTAEQWASLRKAVCDGKAG